MFSQGYGLNEYIEYSGPEKRHIDAHSFKMLAKGTQTPFKAEIIMLRIIILDKIFILLVNRVVGQVHILIIFVKLGSVCLGCKSCKAFLVNVEPERLVACHHNVDSEVELVPIDEERVGHVPRNHRELIHIQIVDVIYNMDAFSLARV
jgi:hypothetical protein